MNTRAHWRLILGLFALFLSAGVAFTLATANPENQRIGAITAPVQPVTLLVTARAGGVVTEVLSAPGAQVVQGATLVRFDTVTLSTQRDHLAAALRSTRSALESANKLSALPAALRATVIEVHPEVTAAEEKYVRAVAALDRDPNSQSAKSNWQQAATERTQVRERLGQSLANPASAEGLKAMIPLLESRLQDLNQALAISEIRAPANGQIDILDLHPGDRLPPGAPAAVLLLPNEYFCQFPLPLTQSEHLKPGMAATAEIGPQRHQVRWHLESLELRTIPVGLRDNRHISQERLVRARFTSPLPNLRGATAVFQLPTPEGSK